MPDTYSVDNWILGPSSTVYMDGTADYYLRMPGKPGIVATLNLTLTRVAALREVLQACLDVE
jgi:hypothetical protein